MWGAAVRRGVRNSVQLSGAARQAPCFSPTARSQKSGKAETVRNVTVRQVVRDNVNSLSDKNMVDGHELQLVRAHACTCASTPACVRAAAGPLFLLCSASTAAQTCAQEAGSHLVRPPLHPPLRPHLALQGPLSSPPEALPLNPRGRHAPNAPPPQKRPRRAQMTLCGRITSHVGAGTGAAISFMLDDGTGALEGLQYVNDITPEQAGAGGVLGGLGCPAPAGHRVTGSQGERVSSSLCVLLLLVGTRTPSTQWPPPAPRADGQDPV